MLQRTVLPDIIENKAFAFLQSMVGANGRVCDIYPIIESAFSKPSLSLLFLSPGFQFDHACPIGSSRPLSETKVCTDTFVLFFSLQGIRFDKGFSCFSTSNCKIRRIVLLAQVIARTCFISTLVLLMIGWNFAEIFFRFSLKLLVCLYDSFLSEEWQIDGLCSWPKQSSPSFRLSARPAFLFW